MIRLLQSRVSLGSLTAKVRRFASYDKEIKQEISQHMNKKI